MIDECSVIEWIMSDECSVMEWIMSGLTLIL